MFLPSCFLSLRLEIQPVWLFRAICLISLNDCLGTKDSEETCRSKTAPFSELSAWLKAAENSSVVLTLIPKKPNDCAKPIKSGFTISVQLTRPG